ncbi:MAG: hemolysin III family protein [Candidatus Sulfotelmatobacter sp.]
MALGQQTEIAREEPENTVTQGFGLVLSIPGVVALVGVSILRGSAWHIVSCTVYGFTLVLLYLSSTLYHAISSPHLKQAAGTLTPLKEAAGAVLIAAASNNLIKGFYAYSLSDSLSGRETRIQAFGLLAGLAAVGLIPLFWI